MRMCARVTTSDYYAHYSEAMGLIVHENGKRLWPIPCTVEDLCLEFFKIQQEQSCKFKDDNQRYRSKK